MQTEIMEPCGKLVERDNALLAKALVQLEESVPIRLLNVSDEVKTVKTGTAFGEISAIDEVISTENKVEIDQMQDGLDNELRKLVES